MFANDMLDARDLMDRHIEALFTHDSVGQLLSVREPNGGPAPRFFVGRTADDITHRFRYDVPNAARRDLLVALADDDRCRPPHDASNAAQSEMPGLAAILARSAVVERTSAGPAYAFPDDPLAPGYGTSTVVRVTDANVGLLHPLLVAWIPDVHQSPPLMAAVIDDQAVAVCGSVRITARAHEAGVETSVPHRGHGHAAHAVAAWAKAVRELGAEPLYSTSWDNTASRAVARKLGLIHFGNDLHLT